MPVAAVAAGLSVCLAAGSAGAAVEGPAPWTTRADRAVRDSPSVPYRLVVGALPAPDRAAAAALPVASGGPETPSAGGPGEQAVPGASVPPGGSAAPPEEGGGDQEGDVGRPKTTASGPGFLAVLGLVLAVIGFRKLRRRRRAGDEAG